VDAAYARGMAEVVLLRAADAAEARGREAQALAERQWLQRAVESSWEAVPATYCSPRHNKVLQTT
jgi:hypothetical protein